MPLGELCYVVCWVVQRRGRMPHQDLLHVRRDGRAVPDLFVSFVIAASETSDSQKKFFMLDMVLTEPNSNVGSESARTLWR
eukprot:4562045-Heterocapsa_arctica.AAC.1